MISIRLDSFVYLIFYLYIEQELMRKTDTPDLVARPIIKLPFSICSRLSKMPQIVKLSFY